MKLYPFFFALVLASSLASAQTTPATDTTTPGATTDASLVPAPPATDYTPAVSDPAPASTVTATDYTPTTTEPATISAATDYTPATTDQTLVPVEATSTWSDAATTASVAETPAVVAATTDSSFSSSPPMASAAMTHSGANALKKANVLYNKRAYSEAIPYYEKARAADNSNKLILSNLGDCYRLTNNASGQLNCYGELVRAGTADPIHEFYYAEALVEMGEAEKAKPFFEKYTADSRGKEKAASLSKAKTYTRNMDAYVVTQAAFNSPQSDICAVKFNDVVVFASTREKTSWIKRQQGWTNGNYLQLYTCQMDGSTIPILFMGDLRSKFNDGPICFSKDYNTVYFTRNNTSKQDRATDGTYKLKLFEALLDQNGFAGVRVLPFNNNEYNCAHPNLSPDGYTLYFASDMPGGKGGMDIYKCILDSSGNWGAAINMGDAINTAGNETFPFMDAKGLLYFSSDGRDGLGGLDIYEARLNGASARVYNMGEPVNSRYDDFGIFIFEDGKFGYLSSNRKAGDLDDDIYTLQILRDVKRGKDLTIVTKDKSTGEILPNTQVLVNADTMLTNEKGEYLLSAEEGTSYKLLALKTDYFNVEDSVFSDSLREDASIKEMALEKDPKLFLRGLVTDAKTNELLEGVNIKVMDIATNTDLDLYTTTASGDYFKFLYGSKIGDNVTYLIKLEKPGYLQRTMIFTHTIEKPGEINLNEMLNLSLGKVEVGMDLAKMIDLKPIYFDMGKSVIRVDAAIELDKIVQVMNEYPNMYIELGSHTDCRSSAASNLKLSTARAKASAAYIVKKGVNKLRITGKGYGETKILNNCICEGPMQSSCPEEEHAKNRRTEFVITKLK